MAITQVQEKMIRAAFENNLGESMENIVDNHPDIFSSINVDKDFAEVISNIYNEVNNSKNSLYNIPPDDVIDTHTNDSSNTLTTMMDTIHEQQEINVEQKKKISEVSEKVDNLVKFIKDIADHPEQLLQSLQGGKPKEQNIQAEPQSDTVGQKIAGLSSASPAGSGFTMDKITEILGLVTKLKGMDTSQKSYQPDPMSSMTNGLQMATQLAGALGGALSTMFEAFDGMQNKAYNSWGKRFTGKSIDTSNTTDSIDYEELSKKITEKMKKEGK